MAVTVSEWDVSKYLESEEDISAYLTAVMYEGEPALLQTALGDVAKARGMSEIAHKANVGRESLYKSLSPEGNPSFKTIAKVLSALGVRMTFAPVSEDDDTVAAMM